MLERMVEIMDYAEKRFRKTKKIVDRLICDEVVIVPVGTELSKQGVIYNLDPVGAKIWQYLDKENSVTRIKDFMVETMDVSPEVAERDLIDFVKDLESAGAIEEIT